MSVPITPRRLDWLVRSLGTDLSRWPAAERGAALDLLRRSAEAQASFAEALARDEEPLAGEERSFAADHAVFDRMQAGLRRHLAPLSAGLRGICIGALVACVAAGLYLGFYTDAADANDVFNSAQTVTFAALDQ